MGRLVGAILFSVGLVIACAGAYFFWGTQALIKNSLRADAKVIDLRKPPASRYFHPVVMFEGTDGSLVTAMAKSGSNPPHRIGDSVRVFYRAESPQDIVLDEPLELYLTSCITGGIGLIFVLVGGGMLSYAIRRRR